VPSERAVAPNLLAQKPLFAACLPIARSCARCSPPGVSVL
jgi:hypothetical protein